MNALEETILAAMEQANDEGLLFGGNPDLVDPAGWVKSTLPTVAERIAEAIHDGVRIADPPRCHEPSGLYVCDRAENHTGQHYGQLEDGSSLTWLVP